MNNKIKMNLFQIIRRDECVSVISKLEKDDLAILDDDGNGLLHNAISYGKVECAIALIKKGIDLDIQNNKGMSTLHILPFHQNTIIANSIVERNPNISLKDNFGNNPLWYAVFNSRGNYEIVKIYLKLKPDIYCKNKAGRSPLDFAKQINDENLITLLTNEII